MVFKVEENARSTGHLDAPLLTRREKEIPLPDLPFLEAVPVRSECQM